ncbi:type VI secretion system-associated FHA domain protein TagH [Massilia scottii]|uniref:type VI secretion system-associated FHA domain protein TagH n=1 Tax=Massilia scottii TaxID=3057166 RepID=UPI002796D27B|nr:type VI secretion system-associated FHA domain protein TagH [Massilia sp. CCM 9029]MDQ1832424.1 type VI secretion system-associated FHA domain protein TagH [Massilia sp. CCM 9029]
MSLTLRILSYLGEAPGLPAMFCVGHAGASVGRAPGCAVALPDPGQIISREHARVIFEAGRYSLTDVGRNPSAINGRPLDSGECAPLANGDLLTIGDYVLAVELEPVAQAPAILASHALAGLEEAASTNILDLIGASAGADGDDPLGLLTDGWRAPDSGAAEFDHVASHAIPMAQARLCSAPRMLIPDDYDPLADLMPATDSGERAVLHALLTGMGLSDTASAQPATELAHLAGVMLRQAIAGAMAVLKARAAGRRDARYDVQVLPEETRNPLLACPDAESALAHLLFAPDIGAMGAGKAIASAFDGVRCHEAAIEAGLRAALGGVIARLDPERIAADAGPAGALARLLPAQREARLWERAVHAHDDLALAARHDFEQLFGAPFAAAYDARLRKMQGDR